jgi:septum formation inhibitor MinC
MDSMNAALAEPEPTGPAAVMRGTARGLEWNIDGGASTGAIVEALEAKLAEAPTFFRNSNVRIAVEGGPLANLCLVQLAELASRYELRIVEVGAVKPVALEPVVESVPQPTPSLAEGSAPTELDDVELIPAADFDDFEEKTRIAIPVPLPMPVTAPGTRLFVGPVRSGVILDHTGNLIVFGDVNPGAEVRATGNIVVLGRLKGTAHAAIGSDTGFILALRLEPQQLRIGRRVARAADNDASSNDAEIAYATGDQMIVERYKGLPRNLATAI